MKHYDTARGIELIPTSDSDRLTLLALKTRFPELSFFTLDINDQDAGLVIVEEEEK